MAAIKPRTWGSGASAPEDTADQRLDLLGALLIVFVVAPLPTLVATLTYQFGLVWARLRWQVLAVTGGALVMLWRIFGGSFSTYFTGHRELIAAVRARNVKETVSEEWLRWLLLEMPAAIAFGVLIGALYSAWRWARRPVWEEDDRRPYPWIAFQARKVRAAIAADEDGPTTGVTIGIDPVSGERIVQTDAEGGAHTLVTGGSGTGKSTAILMQMRDVIRQGRGLVLIDLKGSDDLPEQIAAWCGRYGRVFHHWTFQDPSEPYDGPAAGLSFYEPVGRGDATRRAGMLLATREWSTEADHYKRVVEGFLQVMFNVFTRVPNPKVDALADMVSMATNPQACYDRAQRLFDAAFAEQTAAHEAAKAAETAEAQAKSDAIERARRLREGQAGAHLAGHSQTLAEPDAVTLSTSQTGVPTLAIADQSAAGGDTQNTMGESLPWQDNWRLITNPEVSTLLQSIASYLTFGTSGPVMDETVKAFGQSLNTFKQSIAGRQLAHDPDGLRDIDLSRVAREGQVVVFSLNSSNYPEPAAALGAMIIQDLKTVSAELRGDPVWFASEDPRHRLHVYIDEFGALKADNTKTLLQQVRDARISVSLSTQSVSDLAYHSPEFRDALLNTVASFLALRPNTTEEAETLAGLSGGQMRTRKQIGIEQATSIGGIDTGAATGGGFLREEMGFVIEPHTFQALRIGEAVYISSGGGARRAVKVDVVKEDTGAVQAPNKGLVTQHGVDKPTDWSSVAGTQLPPLDSKTLAAMSSPNQMFPAGPDPLKVTHVPAGQDTQDTPADIEAPAGVEPPVEVEPTVVGETHEPVVEVEERWEVEAAPQPEPTDSQASTAVEKVTDVQPQPVATTNPAPEQTAVAPQPSVAPPNTRPWEQWTPPAPHTAVTPSTSAPVTRRPLSTRPAQPTASPQPAAAPAPTTPAQPPVDAEVPDVYRPRLAAEDQTVGDSPVRQAPSTRVEQQFARPVANDPDQPNPFGLLPADTNDDTDSGWGTK